MEDLRTEQIEALKVAVPYIAKISKAIDNVCEEFTVERKEDTDAYFDSIMKGLNWIFEVYNATRDLINEDAQVVDKENVNNCVMELNAANNANDDAKRAEALAGIKEFITLFAAEAEKKFEA